MKSIGEIASEMKNAPDPQLPLCASCGASMPPSAAPGEICRDCGTQRAQKAQRERVLKWLDLPEHERRLITSGKLSETKALTHVRDWLGSDTRILVLCGGVGTGKSIAAGYALWRVGGAAVRATELPQRIDPWSDEERDRYGYVELSNELIVLDDLGEEPGDARWWRAFSEFISDRYARGRTLITTNLRKRDLRSRYGDRVADRLNHVGIAREIKGGTQRKKGDL